ncbi:Ig-like domain-containing protein [Candidatus Palauibacter sp.]|uniref:Ig-like domain-containing protein n=1 Tax=Candidatus Palauibacter sp. TaxID=3101350 RepID=UPI003AF2E930
MSHPTIPLPLVFRAGKPLQAKVHFVVVVAALAALWTAACGDGVTEPAPTPNRAPLPSGSIPALTINVGQTATVNVAGNFIDPDGDALTYAATSTGADVASATVSGDLVTVTAVARGTVSVTVTATDPGGLSAAQSFEASVPNRAPEPVGAIPDQTVHARDSVTLDVSAHFTDPDGDTLNYTAVTVNASVATASVSGAMLTIRGVAVGETTVTVTATDPDDADAVLTADVAVKAPGPDLIFTGVSPASATLTPDSSVTFRFRVRNRGAVASSATTIRGMRSPNDIVSTRDTELRSYSFSPLGASEERTFPLTISVDARSAAGTIYIGMCVDSVRDETNTRNNCSEGARLTIVASSTGRRPPDDGDRSGIPVRASRPPAGEPGGDRVQDWTR